MKKRFAALVLLVLLGAAIVAGIAFHQQQIEERNRAALERRNHLMMDRYQMLARSGRCCSRRLVDSITARVLRGDSVLADSMAMLSHP